MNDSELDQLLKSVDAPPPPPPGFQRDVWLRIEAAESASWRTSAGGIIQRFFARMALPPLAITACAAMIVAGTWLGLKTGDPPLDPESHYLQSVSPFSQTRR